MRQPKATTATWLEGAHPSGQNDVAQEFVNLKLKVMLPIGNRRCSWGLWRVHPHILMAHVQIGDNLPEIELRLPLTDLPKFYILLKAQLDPTVPLR